MAGEIARSFGVAAVIGPFSYSALNYAFEAVPWYCKFSKGSFDFNLGHRDGAEISLVLIQEFDNFFVIGDASMSIQYPEKDAGVQKQGWCHDGR